MRQVFTGADLFDGVTLYTGHALVVEDGHVAAITPNPPEGAHVALAGGVLAPGMIDLQVNGGGGRMVGAGTTATDLAELCAVHGRLGALAILPTLITATPEVTAQVLDAGIKAVGTPGFLGLHLEGPHIERAGAHDPALIRPMGETDLEHLCNAARHLPALMVTLAPAAVTQAQIAALAQAGVIVSLGHADCTFAQAEGAKQAGARVVTHLFNAMSGLTHREPGLAGAAMALDFDVGLIADGQHVHPATMALALRAKGAGRVFLVSDAMAVAGSDAQGFDLGGRRISRAGGRLTLADGTLAGADLTLPQAVRVLVTQVGIPLAQALAMATSIPAEVIGQGARHGHLLPGRAADMVHLGVDGALQGVWRGGRAL